MTRPQQPPVNGIDPSAQSGEEAAGAFDLWLQRSLHQLFDPVVREPIPESLLRLIEQNRAR